MRLLTLLTALVLALTASAQTINPDAESEWKRWRIAGSVEANVLVPQDDDVIGTEPSDTWALTNSYLSLSAINKYVEAGARLEFTEYPLPGFEPDFKGWGVPYYYAKFKPKGFEITGGTFYEQFGSGLILRTYEERSLGIDNSLRGGRVVMDRVKGLRLKVLAGQQRRYWKTNPAVIYGADAEISIHDYSQRMRESNTALTIGGSWVTKHEKQQADNVSITYADTLAPDDPEGLPMPVTFIRTMCMPTNIGSFDARVNLRKGNYAFLAEYAQKSQDPSYDNGFIFHTGRALLLSGSYSKRGMSFLFQAKRSEDMSLRSDRMRNLTSSFINHLPAFTQQQTYALATIYPYATQNAPGEWAFQTEGSYTFKRKTPLGGRYGTTIKASFSHVHSLEGVDRRTGFYTLLGLDPGPQDETQTMQKFWSMGTDGYTSKFWKLGDQKFYQEFTVDFDKKISRTFKLNLKYLNQHYNKTVIEGEGGMIKTHIIIGEGKWNITPRYALRAEAQYLHTKQDQGDWWFGLVEFSLLPHFMFTVSDQYNAHVAGGDGEEHKVHYYNALVTFTHKSHRLAAGYGKTRAGYNCSGGVCRYVPAQKGFTLNYNFTW